MTIAKTSTSAMDEKIGMALKCVGNPVLQLPNRNANVQKYSVLAGDSIEFVNIFQSDSNEGFLICFNTIYLLIIFVGHFQLQMY